VRRLAPLLALAALGAAPEGEPPRPHAVATEVAVFAGGCFWCMEPPFDALDGVLSTTAGYTGGALEDPSYEQVSEGGTGHREAVRVEYDPARVSYPRLLEVFWRNVDPLDGGGQFCDRGSQYASAIFAAGADQRQLAEASRRTLERSRRFDRPIATEILDAGAFYPAEPHHQDYARKNPIRYRFYRSGCGRDARLEALWGSAGAHGAPPIPGRARSARAALSGRLEHRADRREARLVEDAREHSPVHGEGRPVDHVGLARAQEDDGTPDLLRLAGAARAAASRRAPARPRPAASAPFRRRC